MKAGIGMVVAFLCIGQSFSHPLGIHYSVFIIPLNIERWTSNDEWWSFGLARLFPFEASSSGISVLQNSTFIIQCSLFLWTSNAEHRMMNDEGLDWNGHRQIVRLSLVSSSFGVHNLLFVIPLNLERWTPNDEWWRLGLEWSLPSCALANRFPIPSKFGIHNSVFIIPLNI